MGTKLAKANTSAREMLNQARRQSKGISEGSLDDFGNRMGLGDPDPSNHRTGFTDAQDIAEWFNTERSDDWRQKRLKMICTYTNVELSDIAQVCNMAQITSVSITSGDTNVEVLSFLIEMMQFVILKSILVIVTEFL